MTSLERKYICDFASLYWTLLKRDQQLKPEILPSDRHCYIKALPSALAFGKHSSLYVARLSCIADTVYTHYVPDHRMHIVLLLRRHDISIQPSKTWVYQLCSNIPPYLCLTMVDSAEGGQVADHPRL